MERTDTRSPFAASGGIIPPELRKIKTPCYVLDEAALIKNAELMGNIAKEQAAKCSWHRRLSVIMTAIIF